MRRALSGLALVALAGCFDDSNFPSDDVIWVLTEMNGQPVTFDATLKVSQDGTLSGLAPCNRFNGNWFLSDSGLTIGPLATTRRACPEMEAETAYLTALQAATEVSPAGEQLDLSGGGQTLVFRTGG
ncbi:MAG: META domain-containing protein [Pseudooceanicola sp.]